MKLVAAILNPLTQYVLLTAGLSLGLYLFMAVKADLRKLARRHEEGLRRVDALSDCLEETRTILRSLETDLHDIERQTGMLVAPQPVRSGLNLSKRTQVLRMHRAGQTNTAIAASLALPHAEVDLLIKIHRLVVSQG